MGDGTPGTGSVSIASVSVTVPWTVTTITTGFANVRGAVFDGAGVWVTDQTAGTLLKLSAAGAVLQTVTVGIHPAYPVFDGTNLWVPNSTSDYVSVVRASTGVALTTLAGNGLSRPAVAACEGQRRRASNRS